MNQVKSAVLMFLLSMLMIVFIDAFYCKDDLIESMEITNESIENKSDNISLIEITNGKIRSKVLSVEFMNKCLDNRKRVQNNPMKDIINVTKQKIEVSTYDINLGLSVDCYSQDTKNLGVEEGYGEYANNVSIVKYYGYKDEMTNEISIISYYITKNNPHIINMIDESDKNGFKLVEWFTSNDSYVPLDGGDISEINYNDIKGNHQKGDYSGLEPVKLEIPYEQSENNNVLHILYLFEPVKMSHTYHVSKYIQDKETGNVTILREEEVTDKNYYDCNEEGYVFLSSKQSVDEKVEITDWDDLDLSEYNESSIVNVGVTTVNLYLLYEKIEFSPIVLYENELNRYYSLSDLTNGSLLSIYDTLNSAPAKIYICDKHNGKECENGELILKDNTWSFTLYDKYAGEDDYNDLTFIGNYHLLDNYDVIGHTDVEGNNGSDYSVQPNARFMLYRPYENYSISDMEKIQNKDLVTLYPNKNDMYLNELNKIHITNENISKEPLGNRYTVLDENNHLEPFGSYYLTFTPNFEYLSHETELKWYWSRTLCGFNNEGIFNTTATPGHDLYSLNNYYGFDNNIEIKYYLGKEGLGNELIEGSNNKKLYSKQLSFYPYYKMLFMRETGEKLPIAVTSENLSIVNYYDSIEVNELNNVELELEKMKFMNLDEMLVEKQLTMQRPLLDFYTICENLSIKNLNVDYYTICMEKENSDLLMSGELLGKEDILKYYNLKYDEIKDNILKKSDKITLADDFEYIIEMNSIKSPLVTNAIDVYKISVDWDGNIVIEKNDILLNKYSSLEEVLKNKEFKIVDDNTKVITNLYNSLEKGLESRDIEGKEWYFEAFDGVEVVVNHIRCSYIED